MTAPFNRLGKSAATRASLSAAALFLAALFAPAAGGRALALPCTTGTITIVNGSTGAIIQVINVPPPQIGSETIHGDFPGPNGTIIDIDICANPAPLPTPIPGTQPQALVFVTPVPTAFPTLVPAATTTPPAAAPQPQALVIATPRPAAAAPAVVGAATGATTAVTILPPNTGDAGLLR